MLRVSTTAAVLLTALTQNYVQTNNKENLAEASDSRITISSFSTPNTSQSPSSLQQQKTAITMDAANLTSPSILNITTAESTQLVGKITVNGVIIKTFNNSRVSVNLSPYLAKRTNSVEIFGNYRPAQNSVQIEFSCPGTKVTQQTGGNGILRQTLIIAVSTDGHPSNFLLR